MTTAALLFATTAAEDGGPAAALALPGSTVLGRLLEQLESLGVHHVWLVTRPGWEAAVEAASAESSADVTVVVANDVGDDLRTTAQVVSGFSGTIVVGSAHVLTHREALVGLLADPRIASGVLATGSLLRGFWSFPIRAFGGHVASAASAYHRVERATGYFLGFIKVEPEEREQLIAASLILAELAVEPRPEGWEQELDRKAAIWRLRLWCAAEERETGIAPDPDDVPEPASLPLDDDDEAELDLRLRAAREDAVAPLLVGLVRAGVHLSPIKLREFFYAAPLSAREAESAAAELSGYDEDRVALDSAVKAKDGFFTTFFVSPYSKYIARFAARRGWTPNTVTTLSFAIGVLAAASFAVGSRPGLIAGAILLQVSFTVDCVDGQLARYTRTFSNLGAWLDSVFDRAKEYLVYGGLAIGASRGFGDDVWTLAAAALALQTVRHMLDFSYAARKHQAFESVPHLPLDRPEEVPLPIDPLPRSAPAVSEVTVEPVSAGGTAVVTTTRAPAVPPAGEPRPALPERRRRLALSALARQAVDTHRALERHAWARWGRRILVLPIGERFALISLTAAIATPRVTFFALLVWGGVAGTYALTGRILSSLAK